MSSESNSLALPDMKIRGGLLKTFINCVILYSIKVTTFVRSKICMYMAYLDAASTQVTKYVSPNRCPRKLIGPAKSELKASPGFYTWSFL